MRIRGLPTTTSLMRAFRLYQRGLGSLLLANEKQRFEFELFAQFGLNEEKDSRHAGHVEDKSLISSNICDTGL